MRRSLEATRPDLALLSALLDANEAPALVVGLDPDRLCLAANQAAARLLARPVDQLVGAPAPAFTSALPEDYGNQPSETSGWVSRRLNTPDGRHLGWLQVWTPAKAETAIACEVSFQRRLIQMVCHDLRNPLGSINLATQALLARKPHTMAIRRVFGLIQRSVWRIDKIVGDLVDYAAVGGLRCVLGPTRLHSVCHQIVEELRLSWKSAQLEVRLEGDDLGCWDEHRLARAISNLLANALEYGDPTKPIRLTARGSTTEPFVIEVHNYGKPIPTEMLAVLFDPVQRTATTKATGRHLGLGLYIARQAAELNGGSLEVRSDWDTGTTFTLRLPRTLVASTGAVAPTMA